MRRLSAALALDFDAFEADFEPVLAALPAVIFAVGLSVERTELPSESSALEPSYFAPPVVVDLDDLARRRSLLLARILLRARSSGSLRSLRPPYSSKSSSPE